jgi:hypothetical protein
MAKGRPNGRGICTVLRSLAAYGKGWIARTPVERSCGVYELFVGKQPTVGADLSASSAIAIEQTKADKSTPTLSLRSFANNYFIHP